METINQRIETLRTWMRQHHLDAFIFTSSDDHDSEYPAPHFQTRQWISGFDGSAGTAVVTMNEAALWTDSRYWLAATDELSGTPFGLMRDGDEHTPTISGWLKTVGAKRIGVDAKVVSRGEIDELSSEFTANMAVDSSLDPAEDLWTSRPELPIAPLVLHPETVAGETTKQKIRRLTEVLNGRAEMLLVTALDEIAWILNLRGSDVEYNPVFYSYLLIDTRTQGGTLYVDHQKLTEDVTAYLETNHITTAPYEQIGPDLQALRHRKLQLPSDAPLALSAVCSAEARMEPSPVALLKAIKNETEQEGFRRSMVRDGVALVRLLNWMETAIPEGGETEISIDRKLTALRAKNPEFRGLSFATIAAYGMHGAIVHYEATPETSAKLRPEGVILLDTGAQYVDGTTDITRTIALGPVSAEMRRVYTLVLKGHIALARCRFPKGSTGLNVDLAARYAMWREGMDFGHGTGHGVGSCLCVHEGPQQIRKNLRGCTTQPLLAGMTITDEPGLYLEGRFGVRIENMLLIRPFKTTEFGEFLEFETLTLCPYDRRLIDTELLTPEEIEWINRYHAKVESRLLPLLQDESEKEWVKRNCEAILMCQ